MPSLISWVKKSNSLKISNFTLTLLKGISLYSPRMVETANKRFTIDLPSEIKSITGHPHTPFLDQVRSKQHTSPPHLTNCAIQVPCSWGALFSPTVWKQFRSYLRTRLAHGADVQVGQRIAASFSNAHQYQMNIPRSRINGWKGSWKKYLMEMSYSQGIYMLYPNFYNQVTCTK